MAFVAITAGTIILMDRAGKTYNLAFTKAAAVGTVTFTQDGQTFYRLPSDMKIVDCYIGDTVNKTDYLEVYADSLIKPQCRIYAYAAYANTTTPRITPSGWFRAGQQFALYWYSA